MQDYEKADFQFAGSVAYKGSVPQRHLSSTLFISRSCIPKLRVRRVPFLVQKVRRSRSSRHSNAVTVIACSDSDSTCSELNNPCLDNPEIYQQ